MTPRYSLPPGRQAGHYHAVQAESRRSVFDSADAGAVTAPLCALPLQEVEAQGTGSDWRRDAFLGEF